MQFNQSIILFSLFTAIIASPILESPLSSNIVTRGTSISEAAYDIKRDDDAPFSLEKRSELSIRQAPTLKDVTCPDNKKTYTAETIKEAIKTENAKASPGQYGNQEGGKKLFAVDTQLYKASLDSELMGIRDEQSWLI